jgi:3-oxoacyl-[acyl-carrier protein] reductase
MAVSRRPVALVTGAKRGIGRGIAISLAERGFDMVLNNLEHDQVASETLEHLQSLGSRVAFVAADISKLEGHASMVEAAFTAFGTLDCLVNNVGVSVAQRGDLLEVTPESFDRVMGINLRGTFFLTQTISARMLKETRGLSDLPRSIITISNFNAVGVSIDRAEYDISKASLSMMVKLFAVRLAPHGMICQVIRVLGQSLLCQCISSSSGGIRNPVRYSGQNAPRCTSSPINTHSQCWSSASLKNLALNSSRASVSLLALDRK